MMTRTAIVAACLALAACTHNATPAPTTKVSEPLPAEGKPMAPVDVTAELSSGTARVSVRFVAAASDVTVGVSGADGLKVTSAAAPLTEASAKQNETRTFDVAFTPGPGRSMLVVNVTGTFNGARSTRVVSFDVGTPTADQLTSPGTTIESGGERIKVMGEKKK